MKVAILTLPLHTNYGGILQAYALQTAIEKMGHEVVHLQPKVKYPHLHPGWIMPLVWMKRVVRKFLGGETKLPVFMNPNKWIRKNTDEFIKDYIKVWYLDDEDWNRHLESKFDVLILGSDQIWRPKYAFPLGRYYADFIRDAGFPIIAYAASFGTDKNEYVEEKRRSCLDLVQRFKAVSVREKGGIRLCKDLFNVAAIEVVDPTLLLGRDIYSNLINLKKTKPLNGDLMVYILDRNEETDELVNIVSDKTGYKPFYANSKVEQVEANITDKLQPRVEQWLKGFEQAQFVVTDSFHACVFSIIYHKPFIVYGNISRGLSRFESLLNKCELYDRMITSLNDFKIRQDDLMAPMDYDRIDKILEGWRSRSFSFFTDCGL